MKTNITGYVILTCKYHKEDRNWVGVCEELGTSTFGRTLDEVGKRLKEAIALHLNALEDVGEDERFFKENNIKFYKQKPSVTSVNIKTNSDDFVTSCVQRIGAGELIPA
jgi:predicted RNase H-like HicB family nuclease